ncbi:MAG: hypothetical protein AAGB51_08835 [Planctomycetota bacterium]
MKQRTKRMLGLAAAAIALGLTTSASGLPCIPCMVPLFDPNYCSDVSDIIDYLEGEQENCNGDTSCEAHVEGLLGDWRLAYIDNGCA